MKEFLEYFFNSSKEKQEIMWNFISDRAHKLQEKRALIGKEVENRTFAYKLEPPDDEAIVKANSIIKRENKLIDQLVESLIELFVNPKKVIQNFRRSNG